MTPDELLLRRAQLDRQEAAHLQQVLAEWQILADLSFADLLLFVPVPDRRAYLCVGQMRPYTAQTIYLEDLVGEEFPVTDRPMVGRALAEGRVIRDADPEWSTGVPVREEAIPVREGDRLIGVVTREANVATARLPSALELTYLQTAGELAQMIADGTFPYEGSIVDEQGLSPRVGDGVIRLDADGELSYASPNAISAYRRLGRQGLMVGERLAEFEPEPQPLLDALTAGWPEEGEVAQEGASVLRRVLPLLAGGEVAGGLMLVREVTELRRTEQALRIKDATIREIHHRVKNNLQTVASLLRLQGRRLASSEAREELAESVRRMSSIALVHETLSQESHQRVPFDHIAQRIVDMLADGLVGPETSISFELQGEAGQLPAEVATPLALVLTELLQNSVEHAFTGRDAGTIRLTFARTAATLRLELADDGLGLPEDFSYDSMANLGLSIVRTLAESELGGSFTPTSSDQGTTFTLVLPLP